MSSGVRDFAERRRGDELGTAARSQFASDCCQHVVAARVDTSLGMKLLPAVLSVTAGSVDVISFLGLGGLFTAHITGNLVVLAAHVAMGRAASLALILSVPMFVAVLGLTRLAVAGLKATRHGSLRSLLAMQFFLLVSFLTIRVAAGAGLAPDAPTGVIAGMVGIAAMAVQNAVVQISLVEAPATAVMTTDITAFAMDVGTLLFDRGPSDLASARTRAKRTWPAIVGFTIGCCLGAVLQARIGPWSLALPTSFGLLALALGFSIGSERQLGTPKSSTVRGGFL